MMLLMVAVLLTDVCTVGSNGEPLNVCPGAVVAYSIGTRVYMYGGISL